MTGARLDETATGVFAIAATPFSDGGDIDFDSTERMVEFYIGCGVAGLTILGVMGEAPKLAPEESIAFARRVIERVAVRIPVIVGVTAPGLGVMASLAGSVTESGAAGVMVAPISGLRTDEQIEGYFRAVCGTLGDTPVVLIGDAATRTVRAYASGGRRFTAAEGNPGIVRADGGEWRITEDALIPVEGEPLPRLAGHIAFWFAWQNFRPQAEVRVE